MMQIRRERELERVAFKMAKQEFRNTGKKATRFHLLKLKKAILEDLKTK